MTGAFRFFPGPWPARRNPASRAHTLSLPTQAKALALATLAVGGGGALALGLAHLTGLADATAGDASAVLSPGEAAAAAEQVRAGIRAAARRKMFGDEEDDGG